LNFPLLKPESQIMRGIIHTLAQTTYVTASLMIVALLGGIVIGFLGGIAL
jgi:hypothetical protein